MNVLTTASSCFAKNFRKKETMLFIKMDSSKWSSSDHDVQTVDGTTDTKLPLEEIPTCTTGSKVKCVSDRIVKDGTIKKI